MYIIIAMAITSEQVVSWFKCAVEIVHIILSTLFYWIVHGFESLIPVSLYGKKDISGHVTLITGAGSGLGRLLALRFAKLGAKVVIWDIDENGAKKTVSLIKSERPDCTATFYVCDVSDRDMVYRTAEQVRRDVGDVDILVNNAGVVWGKKFLDLDDNAILKTMQINCISHFWTTKAFLPKMVQRNFGHLVTVSSAGGLLPINGLSDYCASKFACLAFHEALSLELDVMNLKNIQTTLVCPYYMNTGMFAGVATKFSAILPLLCPEYVADKVMDGILTNQKMLVLPKLVVFFSLLKCIIPVKTQYYLGARMEITKAMDNFVGRQKND